MNARPKYLMQDTQKHLTCTRTYSDSQMGMNNMIIRKYKFNHCQSNRIKYFNIGTILHTVKILTRRSIKQMLLSSMFNKTYK